MHENQIGRLSNFTSEKPNTWRFFWCNSVENPSKIATASALWSSKIILLSIGPRLCSTKKCNGSQRSPCITRSDWTQAGICTVLLLSHFLMNFLTLYCIATTQHFSTIIKCYSRLITFHVLHCWGHRKQLMLPVFCCCSVVICWYQYRCKVPSTLTAQCTAIIIIILAVLAVITLPMLPLPPLP